MEPGPALERLRHAARLAVERLLQTGQVVQAGRLTARQTAGLLQRPANPPRLVQHVLLLPRQVLQRVFQASQLLHEDLRLHLILLFRKQVPGLGNLVFRRGGLFADLLGALRPCLAAGPLHVLGRLARFAGGLIGRQPLQPPREPLRLLPQGVLLGGQTREFRLPLSLAGECGRRFHLLLQRLCCRRNVARSASASR